MQRFLLITLLLFSPFLTANEFDISSAFGVHKGMTKSELDKVITDFKKRPQEKNFYCTEYISSYAPIKGDFDYYSYTFYKDNELIGITGTKQNANNEFFTLLLTAFKDKYGNETDSNKNYPLERYHYYSWDLEQDNIDSISIYSFFKKQPNQVKLSYFFIPTKTCLKK